MGGGGLVHDFSLHFPTFIFCSLRRMSADFTFYDAPCRDTRNELLYIIDICASSRGGMTDFLTGNHYYYYIVLFSLLSALLYADKTKIVYHIYWYLHTVCVTSPARQKKYFKYYCPCCCSSVYDLTLLQFILFYVIMQVSVRLT